MDQQQLGDGNFVAVSVQQCIFTLPITLAQHGGDAFFHNLPGTPYWMHVLNFQARQACLCRKAHHLSTGKVEILEMGLHIGCRNKIRCVLNNA